MTTNQSDSMENFFDKIFLFRISNDFYYFPETNFHFLQVFIRLATSICLVNSLWLILLPDVTVTELFKPGDSCWEQKNKPISFHVSSNTLLFCSSKIISSCRDSLAARIDFHHSGFQLSFDISIWKLAEVFVVAREILCLSFK